MITSLSSLIIPYEDPTARRTAVPAKYQGPDYSQKYDFKTLVYDAISVPEKNAVVLICPKLFNLESLVLKGAFTCANQDCTVHTILRRKRFDEVWLKCQSPIDLKQADKILKFQHDSLDLKTQISDNEAGRFADKNCLVAISKNNRPEWIRDWLHYYVQEHGLQGVVIFDNQSDDYPLTKLEEACASVKGLEEWRIVKTPLLFGPTGVKRKRFQSTFLQVAMLNVARIRYFSQANAILSVDIDELVYSKNNSSVFDDTKQSFLGFKTFKGSWLQTATNWDKTNAAPTHKDHIYRNSEENKCPFKFCVDPNGLMGGFPWEIHGIGSSFTKKFSANSDLKYWHCLEINTNWKSQRKNQKKQNPPENAEAQKRLGKVFSAS